ncbi:AI-2E family transporter [Patescibacteria group bacterium]|nr:AI-2E family transporter [Patescibacteria group bacterium]
MSQKIEISSRTIVFTVFFLLGLALLWQIKDLIFSLFIAFIIAGALQPLVSFLETRRFPRLVASLIVYLGFVFVIGYLFALVVPPLALEITHLLKNLPHIIAKTFPNLTNEFDLSFVQQNLPNLANRLLDIIRGFFSNIIFITTTLFFGFYLLLEKNPVGRLLRVFLDKNKVRKIEATVEKAQRRTSGWFWGELILMTIVGIMTYVGLLLIGMKYAVALAVLAGMLEIVPSLGPIVSTVPAALIGFSHSPILGLSNIALYFVVQQLENHLVVPIVMKKVTGLHPIVTLVVLLVAGQIAGILGVLLAVPATIFVTTILKESQKIPIQ